jgi:hypothetical protein
MTRRGIALLCALAAAMNLASPSRAGVWGAQPVIGVVADYYTNPALINIPNTAESHGDLLVDAPTTYVADAYKLTILPSFRISNAQGYSFLDSNYEHLNVSNELDTPRGSLILTGALARDSSLSHDYLLNGSTGVRRDSVLADLAWERQFTERLDLHTDASWTRDHYGQAAGTATLTDYRYASISPTLSWSQSERTKLTVSASVGRYNSLDGATQSTNANLQLGFIKQLSEIWTLSASAGYSRADNRDNFTESALEFTPSGIIIVPIPITLKSTQTGSVYSFTLDHRTSLVTLSATASRQLAPTGFAFLSREELYELKATYTPTERWTLSGDLRRVNYSLPQISSASTNLNVNNVDVSAAWQWTEHWTSTVTATYVIERYGSPRLSIDSTGVSIGVSRRFDWKSFQ